MDIDLERGGGYENRGAASVLFRDIFQAVKSYDARKLVNICFPGMTGVQGSVGGENWCVYADLNPYCDTAAIMSYGMAWAGSAPGPVSPRSWLEGIYNYAVKAISPSKLYLGLPAYGWNWRIHDAPENMGMVNRGVSNTYYAAMDWLNGKYNFTGDAPPQPFIPFIGYWDDYNKVPWAMPHVYDYLDGPDAAARERPITQDVYDRRRYLTCYGKEQAAFFDTIAVDRNGVPDSTSGMILTGDKMITLGANGTATYRFDIAQAGIYDVAIRIGFPFWDKNSIRVSLDGNTSTFTESRLWWPYWRKTCWMRFAQGIYLSSGQHTLVVSLGTVGAQFYGFRVCGSFSEHCSAGSATFTLSPRSFKDINGIVAVPDMGFRLTTEALRRKPDSTLAWYEDFRDESALQDTYWQKLSGEWKVWRDPESAAQRPYSQLEGSGKLAWKYDQFDDVHRCRNQQNAAANCDNGLKFFSRCPGKP